MSEKTTRAARKKAHRIQACKEVEIKPKFNEQGNLLTTWGDINLALRLNFSNRPY